MKPAILERLRGVQRSGDGWLAFCPAHDDRNKRSLSVKVGDDGRTLVHCFAARCTAEQIARVVDMSLAELSGTNGTNSQRPSRREVGMYDYHDERGELVYQVVRFKPKDFRPRRPNGRGGWTWDLKGVRRVVYRLDELAEQRRVVLVEGEKDADRLCSLGIPATTTPSGAESWREEYAEQIKGAGVEEIVTIPDNDEPGRAYARRAGHALARLDIAVRILDLPGLPPKGDISDWLDAGHTAEELAALMSAAPAFTPASDDTLPVTHDAPAEPELRREGFDLALAWPTGARFLLTAIRDGRDGVRGDLTVLLGARRLSWGAFALSSTQARETLRKKLEAVASGEPSCGRSSKRSGRTPRR